MTTDSSIERVTDRVSQLLNRQIGLRAEPTLRGRLERCIRDDAAAGELDGDAYADALMGPGAALQNLVNRVTVQETSFFRHPEHFALLASDVLPRLTEPVLIWSAACSNGQEAYSLAMLLEEQHVDGSVIASDISTAALERTAAAQYTERELLGLSPQRITRHLKPRADGYQVNRSLRARVTPMHFNLLDSLPSQVYACQVVFCRNVLIYFAPGPARDFLQRVSNALPEATLFLGAAESIWQLSDQYDTIRTGDTFTYRRRPPATQSDEQRRRTPKPARAPSRSATTAGHAPTPNASGPRVGNGTGRPARPGPPTEAKKAAPLDHHDDDSLSTALARAGQRASAAGDAAAAVVAFRKCAYLAPHDPTAHLNLGLALETAGDRASAQRAYAAARDAVGRLDGARLEQATGGYTIEDLLRFIRHKQQAGKP